MNLAVGIVAAVLVVVIIFLLMKKSGPKSALPEKKPEAPGSEPGDATAAVQPAIADSKPETMPQSEPPDMQSGQVLPEDEPSAVAEDDDKNVEIAPEGVRLDETAEQTAVLNLKRARRERKLQKLRQGLSKTRGGLIAKIGSLFKERKEIDASLLEELEEVLITSDVGAKTTDWLLTLVKEALDKEELKDPEAVWSLLKEEIRHMLTIDTRPFDFSSDKPFVIMVVGVNGAGKTTTIGKLASQLTEGGQKIVLAAADTFRAAAVNQLEIWGRRTDSEVVKPAKEGADPSSVVFDAIKKAKESGADIVIADTAGRLHTQAPLMEELKKINRVMSKAHDSAPHEILLVLDATNGQNALQQVKEFGEALDITGIVLTKLDGTAKGGVIIGICHEYKVPVRYIGIGEAKDSLRQFDVNDFVDALFVQDDEA